MGEVLKIISIVISVVGLIGFLVWVLTFPLPKTKTVVELNLDIKKAKEEFIGPLDQLNYIRNVKSGRELTYLPNREFIETNTPNKYVSINDIKLIPEIGEDYTIYRILDPNIYDWFINELIWVDGQYWNYCVVPDYEYMNEQNRILDLKSKLAAFKETRKNKHKALWRSPKHIEGRRERRCT